MRRQVLWGILLPALGAVIAAVAIAGPLFLLIYAVPLILIGIALVVWRGREDTIEAIRE